MEEKTFRLFSQSSHDGQKQTRVIGNFFFSSVWEQLGWNRFRDRRSGPILLVMINHVVGRSECFMMSELIPSWKRTKTSENCELLGRCNLIMFHTLAKLCWRNYCARQTTETNKTFMKSAKKTFPTHSIIINFWLLGARGNRNWRRVYVDVIEN